LPYDIVKGDVAEQVGICTYLCSYNSVVYHQKIKKKIFKLRWCPIFHIGGLIIGLFDDLGWCLILAQPWVRSDINGLKKNGTPDGNTNGLGFANSGLVIHTNFSGENLHKKFFLVFLILI
jgi:hypothetical protein